VNSISFTNKISHILTIQFSLLQSSPNYSLKSKSHHTTFN